MKQENKMSKTKLMPFDIEKAKNGAKVVTRCGYPVTIIGCNSNKKYPIRAIIKTEDGPFTFSFTVEGKYCVDEEEHELDFFIEEEDVEEEVEETDYDPYKATVESIADMVESYSELQSIEELKDFYNNVKIKCRDAFEYDNTWCKKQGEKPADNKPEFQEGDWVIDGLGIVHQIIRVVENLGSHTYGYDTDDGFYIHDSESGVRLWNINDAKEGDVLVKGSNIFIFHFINDTFIMGFCHINTDDDGFYIDLGKLDGVCLIDDVVTPATKEQCNFLFQKMKEAGYEWNSDKKELHKIEAKFKVGDKVVLKRDKSLVGSITLVSFIGTYCIHFKDFNAGWYSEQELEPYEMIEKDTKIRSMTNQELADWLRKCPEEFREFTFKDGASWVYSYLDYLDSEADEPAKKNKLIRRNHGEWQEPLIEE